MESNLRPSDAGVHLTRACAGEGRCYFALYGFLSKEDGTSLFFFPFLLSTPNRLWVFPNSSLHSPKGGREEVHSAAPHDSSSGNRRASEQACGHMCAGVCVRAIYSRHPTSVFALLCLASPYLFIRAAVIYRGCVAPLFPPLHITVWRCVGYVDRRHLLGLLPRSSIPLCVEKQRSTKDNPVHVILY